MTEDVRPEGKTAVLLALARGCSATEAAAAGGVSDRTVRRWLENPGFRAEVNRQRAEMLGQTAGALVDAATEAVATLRGALGAEAESVRVRAAVAILNALVTVRETVELEERVAALEAAATEGAA